MIFASVVLPAAVIAAVPPATSAFGFAGAFLLLAALGLVSLACLAWFPRMRSGMPSDAVGSSLWLAARKNGMAIALTAMALFVSGYVAAWYFFERIGNQSGLDHVSVLDSLAMGSLIGGFGGFLAVMVGRWMSIDRSFVVAIAVTISSLLCFEFLSVTLILYFFVVVIFQLCVNVNFSNIMTFIAMNDAGGRAIPMIPGVQSAGAMAGSIVAGLAFDGWGRTGVVVASIAPFAICTTFMASAFRQSPARPVARRRAQ